MARSLGRSVEVFRVHPITLWVSALISVLLQAFLPLKIPIAGMMDFPLLAIIYFSLVRRNKVFGIIIGTVLGILQDALSHGYIGVFGTAKAVSGYVAAAASVRFNLESIIARSFVTGLVVLVHSLCLAGVQHALLEFPPPFHPMQMASGILINVALGLIMFLVLDRFKHPA